ncbi:hypothetical protein [Halosimplex marinum]|uniref:hypothetical protein n=1 Tax=Halosimplex marinum TaxID=3396620 RepID=UPI003F57F162
MNPMRALRRLLGRSDTDETTYRCIRCGDEFESDYRDCPTCGQPYVTELEE